VPMQPYDFGESSRPTQEILRESEERFRLLVEGVKEYAIFMLDVEGRVTTWNPGARRIKGYEPEEIIGEHFSTFYTQEDVERGHPEEVLGLAAADGRYEEEGLRVRKDGSTFWADVVITALTDESGNLRGFAKVTRDITARKEAEDRERLLLREQAARERATAILESISDAFFAVDVKWNFTYVNGKAEEFWGRSREELLGKNVWEEFPQAAGSEFYRQIERAMEEGVTTEFETISPAIAGWVAGRAYPSREGLSVYFQDVTEHRRAQEELRGSRDQLAAILRGAAEGITAQDPSGKVIYANEAAARLTGFTSIQDVVQSSPDELIARYELLDEEGSPFPAERLPGRRALKGEVGAEEVLRFRILATGEERWAIVKATPIFGEQGTVRMAVNILRDITESKRAQESLRRVTEAERKRIAHDLHDGVLQDLSYTAAAIGMILLQTEGTQQKEQLQSAIDAVRRSARGLREVVNDLRIEEEEGRPFQEIVESVVRRNRTMARGCEINLEVGEGAPSTPLGETGTQVSRIIQEALTNARRHSGAKKVTVSMEREGDDLLIEVSDDHARRRVGQHARTGRAQRRRAGYREWRGAGNKREIAGPVIRGGPGMSEQSVTGLIRVIHVEDHADFRDLLEILLNGQSDIEVVAQAGSLVEARAHVARFEFDVAVLDLGLPDGDGLDLISDLRQANPEVGVLILSANLDAGSLEMAAEADEIMDKLAPVEEVIGTVRRLGNA
jgi:PAS domain S-box-containing protein